jgi:hypothetical protein
MNSNETQKGGLSHNPVIITIKRAVSLSRTHVGLAIFMALLSIILISTNGTAASTAKAAAKGAVTIQGLIVPLMILPAVIIVTPIILLYVYDKNNGLLEYFLSLGMTQEDIYKRYLKAALLLGFIFLVVDGLVQLSVGVLLGGILTYLAETITVSIVIGISIVSLLLMVMMSVSSLQKSRMGGNQPLGLIIGFVMVIPDYVIPFIPPASLSLELEILQAAIIAIAAITMLFLSNRLIKREKLLP